MAIYVHCPQCHRRLEVLQPECNHCGAELPPGVLYALSAALGKVPLSALQVPRGEVPSHVRHQHPVPSQFPAQSPPPPSSHSALRPWLAASLSLVCGLGQLYNGQAYKGTLLLLLGAASVASIVTWQAPVAMVVAAVVWPYAMVDAYLVARHN